MHARLARNLGIDAQRLLPGNFYVIRNVDAPAILTESSYLTNPDVEAKLQLAAKQRLEAEAIFLGLVDHFARGVPRLLAARVEPGADVARGGDPREAVERPWLVLDADRPLAGARLVVDGAAVDSAELRFEGSRGALAGFRRRCSTARTPSHGWRAARAAAGRASPATRSASTCPSRASPSSRCRRATWPRARPCSSRCARSIATTARWRTRCARRSRRASGRRSSTRWASRDRARRVRTRG